MGKILKPDFFNRSTLLVARELLGKYLIRNLNGREVASMIVEIEAYDGFKDKACHASRGQTPRNTPMFDGAGTIYVYFTYGMHFMLNLVTGEKGYPAGVLIRGLKDVTGPGRLTKWMQIDKKINHLPLGKKAGLWVEDRGVVIKNKDIERTPRVGIGYAGAEWAEKPYRFVLKKEAVVF